MHAYNCPLHLWDVHAEKLITRNDLIDRATHAIAARVDPATWSFPTLISDNLPLIIETIIQSTKFAILSHTWEKDEFLYADFKSGNTSKRGYVKFYAFCKEAKSLDCPYAWMDSLCINSDSSTELDESIRSMHIWYQKAYVCLVVLASPSPPGLVSTLSYRVNSE